MLTRPHEMLCYKAGFWIEISPYNLSFIYPIILEDLCRIRKLYAKALVVAFVCATFDNYLKIIISFNFIFTTQIHLFGFSPPSKPSLYSA